MSTNINPETGIRYGYISGNSIHSYILDTIMYSVGTDLTYEAAKAEALAVAERQAEDIEEVRIAIAEAGGFTDRGYEDGIDYWTSRAYERLGFDCREDYVENSVECAMRYVYIEEPIIEFEYEGVKGRTSWLGGECNLWIFESPHTNTFALCSPCVPNACNLDQPDHDGYVGYDVPLNWRIKED